MTRALRSGAAIRPPSRGGTAASSAGWTTDGLPCRCLLSRRMRACRSPNACICRRAGSMMQSAVARPAYRIARRSSPSRSSQFRRSGKRMLSGLPKGIELMDVGFGVDARPRMGIAKLGPACVSGELLNMLAWKPGTQPEPGSAAPKKGLRDDNDIIACEAWTDRPFLDAGRSTAFLEGRLYAARDHASDPGGDARQR